MERTYKNLAGRLQAARLVRGISQAQLAAMIGMSQPSYSGLERGDSKSTRKIATLAAALGVDAYWLETGVGLSGIDEIDRSSTNRIAEGHTSYRDADEAALVELFRQLPRKKKRAILDLMAGEQGASGD